MRPSLQQLEVLNRRYGPWLSLALGIVTVFYLRRGLAFAPVAVAVLLLAWMAAEVLRRAAPIIEPGAAGAPPVAPVSGWRRLVLPAAGSVVASLWQNILFYLLPLWWASTVMPSWSMFFPLLLSGMALLSCFDYHWRRWVMERRVAHVVWCATVLFAALVPACTALGMSLRACLTASASASTLAASLAIISRAMRPRTRALVICAATATAVLAAHGFAPALPPVPVILVASGAGTGIQDRELLGHSRQFTPGTRRVYVWFAIAAPARYRQKLRFEWYRDGTLISGARDIEIVGGRPEGFRTWSSYPAPGIGDWRVDLRADSAQLVGRVRFSIRQPDASPASTTPQSP